MENWRKLDLDKKTTGEVALAVFTAEQDLSDASGKRAEAASRLDRAQKEYNDTVQDEKYFYKEHNQLKNYLAERLKEV